jgi:hypothetical protein
MILKLPDLKTLRLALITGAIPSAMAQSSASFAIDPQGQVWIEAEGALGRSNLADLKRLGAMGARSFPALEKREAASWAEMLPLEREAWVADALAQAPVLFDLPGAEELGRVVLECLRLGNDRMGLRWLEAEGASEPRALLRVVGPPYYTLLRALDRIGGGRAPVAYVEKQPGVWVELGWSHPLLMLVQPPAGRIVLVRPPSEWAMLEEAPFRDVYEVTELSLPERPVALRESKSEMPRIAVPLSLRPGGSQDSPELWALQDDPVTELNELVQNASDDLLHRLAFAVGEKGGKKVIVVRARQASKQAPPVLIFRSAQAYKHYLKLPNLFVPAGHRLHPPLRRDQVRKLLADDASLVTWLQPEGKNSFVPFTLPESAFRPLWDWVDYVLDHDAEALEAWMQSMQLDLEAFASEEESGGKPRKPPASEGKEKKPARDRGRGGSDDAAYYQQSLFEEGAEDEGKAAPLEELTVAHKAEPSQLQKRLRELEEAFLSFEGGLDSPERHEAWPVLATLNTQLGNTDDAGICWVNALWDREEEAARSWAWSWFLAEAQGVPQPEGSRSARAWVTRATLSSGKGREVPGDDLDRLLAREEPAAADLRALAAYLVHACAQPNPSEALVSRLGPVSRFLEAHERLLPVRPMWMAWAYLTRLARGDVLALARARDRALERLYHGGLRPEQDLPSFLRFAGQPTSQRFRAVRQWMSELAELAQRWVSSGHTSGQTSAYVDLIFAFGLAKLGEADVARARLASAKSALVGKEEGHQVLYSAFEYRIRQALDGKPHAGPLPTELMEYLEHLERLERYVVDCLRKHSQILEPDTRINPYRHWGARVNEFEKALAEVADLTSKEEVVARVEKLLREAPRGSKGAQQRLRVVQAGLEAAPRVGEEFARKMLEAALLTYDELPEARDVQELGMQAGLLEKALFVAGHFGRSESLHPLVTRLLAMIQAQKKGQPHQAMEPLAASTFRGLRKLGLRDEIDQVLRAMAELVLEGQEVKSIDFTKRDQGPAALRALLQVAGGWYFFGKDAQADAVLQVARQVLLTGSLPAREQTSLAAAYARAAGQAPVEMAQKRLEEVFKSVKGVRDTYTTSTHFMVSQLNVTEAAVLAVVSDDFTMGAQARRWLDDDELLVRRRIHRDVREAMEKG